MPMFKNVTEAIVKIPVKKNRPYELVKRHGRHWQCIIIMIYTDRTPEGHGGIIIILIIIHCLCFSSTNWDEEDNHIRASRSKILIQIMNALSLQWIKLETDVVYGFLLRLWEHSEELCEETPQQKLRNMIAVFRLTVFVFNY
jgi:hypothetical protein